MKYNSTNKNIFFVYMIYFISMILFCGVRILSGSGVVKIDNYYGYNLFFGSLIHLVILLIIPAVLYWALMPKKQNIVVETIQPRPPTWRVLIYIIPLGILLFLFNIGVSSFFSEILYIFGYETPISLTKVPEVSNTGVGGLFFELLITAVYPAICEEFLHRGILLNGAKKIGYKKAIFISGLLFGLMHFSVEKFFYATVLGWIFGLIVVMTKSIWTGVILHFINNALNVYLIYASYNGWWLGDFYDVINMFLTGTSAVVGLLAVILVMLTVVSLILLLIKKLPSAVRMEGWERERIQMEKSLKEQGLEEKRQEVGLEMLHLVLEKSKMQAIEKVFFEASSFTPKTKKDAIDQLLPDQLKIVKPPLWVNIFLIASFVLGALVTLSTFIWGLF